MNFTFFRAKHFVAMCELCRIKGAISKKQLFYFSQHFLKELRENVMAAC